MPRLHLHKSQRNGHTSFKPDDASEIQPWAADQPLRIVGQSHPRVEGAEKVTGRARYAYDQRLPRQSYARVLRSPHPHARIRRIDTSRAENLAGVHAVLSSANCPDVRWYQEQSLLFDTTLRFVGDEVAAAAAETGDVAEDALRLIEVEYEPLPFVADLDAALRPDAPPVHAHGHLASEEDLYARGDTAAGFAEAEVTIERDYVTQTALHNCLEPHGCTASWEPDGQLTLWESTQAIWDVREEIANALHLPHNQVRVIKQYMGGGFGSKQVAWKPTAIAALLSRQAGRPVQLLHDRQGENLAAGNRNPTRQHVRLGARRDGTLTAIDVRIDLAQGAYVAGGEVAMVDGMYQTLYRCANVRTAQYAHYTNTGPAVAFRAPGFLPELAAAIRETPEGISVGALTTLSAVASSNVLRQRFTAVAEAADLAATPQLRNMATLGGNLLQRPRCWYFRSPQFNCWLKGGEMCHAREGENQLHAVLGDSPCVATHPSDPPAALLAFDAEVQLSRNGGSRTLPLADFFLLPTDEHRSENVLQPGEILTAIHLPRAAGSRSTYLKAMNRKAWAFALVGAAAVVELEGSQVRRARLVLNGVAPIPWRAHAAESVLEGAELSDATIASAARTALADAHPLSKNGYKLQLAEGLISQALRALRA